MAQMSGTKNIRETRTFGIVLAVILAGLAAIKAIRSGHVPAWWFGGGSVFVLVVAISAPRALYPLRRAMTAVARVIGWVNTRILLTLTFYILFTPMGLIARLIRKDLLKIRFKSREDSYWLPHKQKEFCREDYKNQF